MNIINLNRSQSSPLSFMSLENRSEFSIKGYPVAISELFLKSSEPLREALKTQKDGMIDISFPKSIFYKLNKADNFQKMKIPRENLDRIYEAAQFFDIKVLSKRCREKIKRRDLLIRYAENDLSEEQKAECYQRVNKWLFSNLSKNWNKLPVKVQESWCLTVPLQLRQKFSDNDLEDLSKFCSRIPYLDIRGCKKLTKKGCKSIKNFTELSCGFFAHTKISSKTVLSLIPKIRVLDLANCVSVDDRVLGPLTEKIKNREIDYLNLYNVNIDFEKKENRSFCKLITRSSRLNSDLRTSRLGETRPAPTLII